MKRGDLNVPVIGVAKAGWNVDQLRARARDSLAQHGGFDAAAFDKLSGLLRYVDGDNGAGLGASHQTGWTRLVANSIQLYGFLDAKQYLEGGKRGAFKEAAFKKVNV